MLHFIQLLTHQVVVDNVKEATSVVVNEDLVAWVDEISIKYYVNINLRPSKYYKHLPNI
jgi:hypothetical protein